MSMPCHHCGAPAGWARQTPCRAKPSGACAIRAAGARCYSSADSRPVAAGPCEWLPRTVPDASVDRFPAPHARPVPAGPDRGWCRWFGQCPGGRSARPRVPAAGQQAASQPAAALPRAGAAGGQHRQQMWLHAAVRRPGGAAEALCRPRLRRARVPVQ
ncbi:hypothetical protein G6F40_015415 [Rhizopus arrhizus]|nr:hypothetical protein G6F40_015415 [Rhizopus arrhizus]